MTLRLRLMAPAFVAVSALSALSALPGHAAPVDATILHNRGAWALNGTSALGLFVTAADMVQPAKSGGVAADGGRLTAVCVSLGVGTKRQSESGCGAMTFTVAPDLSTASLSGSLPTVVRSTRTQRVVGRSRLSFTVTWTATGPPTPSTQGNACVRAQKNQASIFQSMVGELYRPATASASVASTRFGRHYRLKSFGQFTWISDMTHARTNVPLTVPLPALPNQCAGLPAWR